MRVVVPMAYELLETGFLTRLVLKDEWIWLEPLVFIFSKGCSSRCCVFRVAISGQGEILAPFTFNYVLRGPIANEPYVGIMAMKGEGKI